MSLNRSFYKLLQCPSEKKLLPSLGLEKKNLRLGWLLSVYKKVYFHTSIKFSLFDIFPNQEYLVVHQEATFSMRHLKEFFLLLLKETGFCCWWPWLAVNV